MNKTKLSFYDVQNGWTPNGWEFKGESCLKTDENNLY